MTRMDFLHQNFPAVGGFIPTDPIYPIDPILIQLNMD